MNTIEVFISDDGPRRRKRRTAVVLVAAAGAVLLLPPKPAPVPPIPPESAGPTLLPTHSPAINPETLHPLPAQVVATNTSATPGTVVAGPKRRHRTMPPVPTPVPVPVPVPATASVAPIEPPPPRPIEVAPLRLRVDPPALHFVSSGWQPIRITNVNDVVVRITKVAIRGGLFGYQLDSRECLGLTLQPRESCRVTVSASRYAVARAQGITIDVVATPAD